MGRVRGQGPRVGGGGMRVEVLEEGVEGGLVVEEVEAVLLFLVRRLVLERGVVGEEGDGGEEEGVGESQSKVRWVRRGKDWR